MAQLYVIGAGVVGHATGNGFASQGHEVTFVDINDNVLARLRSEGWQTAPPDNIDFSRGEAAFVSVPTPTTESGMDASHLKQACRTLGAALRCMPVTAYPIIVFRSTMLPGTTRDLLIPLLEQTSGKLAGQHFCVCYNPEYLRARTADRDFRSTPRVTIGCDDPGEPGVHWLSNLYAPLGTAACTILTYEEAEFQKYVHNCLNAVKISFFNEMRMAAKSLGIDPAAAFEAASMTAQASWDPQYGILDRGPYGGACLPKDMNAWIAFAERHNLPASVAHGSRTANQLVGGE